MVSMLLSWDIIVPFVALVTRPQRRAPIVVRNLGTMFPGIILERDMHPNVSQVLTVEVLILAIACGVTSSSAWYSAEDGLPNHV